MATWIPHWGSQADKRRDCTHPAPPMKVDDDPMAEAMDVWLSNPDRPGHYFWTYNTTIKRYVFWFEDENLAVEFRMRWG